MSALEALEETSLHMLLTLQAYEVGFPKLSTSSHAPTSPFSGKEEEVLELFDRLEELKIETSLLEAQSRASEGSIPRFDRITGNQLTYLDSRDTIASSLDQQTKGAEREVVEARARYLLRKKVIEAVLTTDPSLRSVHAGENIQARERELLPWIHRRDLISVAHTNLSSSLSDSSAALTKIENEGILVSRKNIALTKTLLHLAEEAKSLDKQRIEDQKSLSQLEVLEKELQFRRSRWRIMKNVVSAVIVGSGMDWVRNDKLRPLVIDDEEGIS
ncbi:hypothetical protein FGG08_004094 [Glutinoglossum americanum]|uniref:Centromere protein H C-terminal domain-containing protein n=1 Tax=Glutinoglossum americanum TaxID=1670608 RepID=A0A9P8L313_9PEZI|nr:hypothetical protein FGG08_004094 [Glutinoglossum americanum]